MASDMSIQGFKDIVGGVEAARTRMVQAEDERLRDIAQYDGLTTLGLALLAELKLFRIALERGSSDA